MIDALRRLLQLDANEAVDLNEGEEILHVTGRHWVELVIRQIAPLSGVLFFGGLALYRAAGGGFLVSDIGEPAGIDLVNIVLLVILAFIGLLWLALWVRRSRDTRTRSILLIAFAAVGLLAYFRYNGGRVFYIDPSYFVDQAGDPLNVILILIAVICGLFTLFTFYDWLNDELILTNQRVVYDNDQVFIPRLLERRVQEQIYIADVQNVVASTKTYPQHWLKYGTVIVKSARFGGELHFDKAIDPKLMQKRIMDVVNAQRKQRSEQFFDRVIEAKVYNVAPERKLFRRDIKTTRGMEALSWLLPENPEINEDNGTITWRAHWLFLLRGLAGPFLLLFFGLLIVALGASLFALEPILVGLSIFAVILGFVGWAAWEIEDYRNDLYILTTSDVIDIEKKPFGPEDRRQASLNALNNISFETTFISNFLGYGNVVLETAGSGGKFTFNRVPRPREVVAKINDYFMAYKDADKEKTLNDMLSLFNAYHRAQQRHNELNTPPS